MMLVLGLFAWDLVNARKPPLAASVRQGFRTEAIGRWVAAGIFFASVAPVFNDVLVYSQPLRIWVWLIPLVFFRFGRHALPKEDTDGSV